eukprot:6183736-Amphidinium_carterae.1
MPKGSGKGRTGSGGSREWSDGGVRPPPPPTPAARGQAQSRERSGQSRASQFNVAEPPPARPHPEDVQRLANALSAVSKGVAESLRSAGQ